MQYVTWLTIILAITTSCCGKNNSKPISEPCHEISMGTALWDYKMHIVGDTIIIEMPVDLSYGSNNAVVNPCSELNWVFNPTKDIRIKCVLKDKKIDGSNGEPRFRLLILNKSQTSSQILGSNYLVNEEFWLPIIRIRMINWQEFQNDFGN